MNILPVLNFHGFQRDGQPQYTEVEMPYVLEESFFIKLLAAVRAEGFESLKTSDAADWKSGRTLLKPLMFTFDDGVASHRDAASILKSKGFTGIFFISAGLVGEKGFLTWRELKDMVQEGHEIGSHGFSHVPLTGLDEFERNREIRNSKRLLEDKLGIEVTSFSVPRGFATPAIHEQIFQAGYEWIFTSRFDVNHRRQMADVISRLAVKRHHSMAEILNWLNGQLGAKKYFEKMKEHGRRWVPVRLYDAMAALKRMGAAK